MSEEIERIIDNLESCVGMFDYMLTPIENNLLVSYIKELQQENKQLKTDLEEANDNATWWNNKFNAVSKENQQLKKANEILKENAIHNDKVVDDTKWKIKQYKSVLDEIREQLKKIEPDLDFEPWSVYKVIGTKLFDLLQILEKADNGTSNE